MHELETPLSAEARVCVSNTSIGITGWQERATFSQNVVKAALDEAKLKCAREAGPSVCRLAYRDITAVASELEEIGYVSCNGGQNNCDNTVSETAVAITAGLKSK